MYVLIGVGEALDWGCRVCFKRGIVAFVCGLVMGGCGTHESTSTGLLKSGNIFAGNREKLAQDIETGNLSAIENYLAAGGSVDTRLENGRTLLIHATVQNQLKIVKVLLRAGANVLITDSEGSTALDHAVRVGNKRAQSLLDPDIKNELQSRLVKAVQRGRRQMIDSVLADGADPNFTDSELNGESPLTFTIYKQSRLAFLALIEWEDPLGISNTDVNFRNVEGKTPLAIAIGLGLQEISEYLRSRGASEEFLPSVRDGEEQSER